MKQTIVFRIIFLLLITVTIGAYTSIKTDNLQAGVVQLKSGMISGVLLDSTTNLRVFKGIPYAEPPVGELRWKAPEPIQKWDSVLTCDTYGNWCPQKTRNDKIQLSEDCLCLNVWSNNLGGDEKLPVMVWIHGGGLNALSSHYNNTLDGDQFAKKGVVLVSMNYRLGQLGFLAHPALSAESENNVSGNYGFLDQLEALRWVQENIEAFGGDPDNVTIFGESAGGLSVSVLCASPLSKGLFHKAIMQSPWMFGFMSKIAKPNITRLREPLASVASAEELGTKWANKYVNEGDDVLEKLRSLDALQVIKDEPYYETRTTIDGWLLNDYPEAVFAKGDQMNIPVMIGTNKNEGTAFWNYVAAKNQEEFTEILTDFYGNGAAAVAGFYPSTSAEETKKAASQFVTESWFLEPADHLVQGMENVTSPAYQYEFTIPSRRWPIIGATHGLEIRYVFDNLNEDAAEVDKAAAETMINYWSQFAKTSDPNLPGLPKWEPYTKNKKSYMELGEEITPKREVPCQACDLIRKKKIKAYN
ncbi:MAG: carboxylesterase family protein [Bacteroidota bacterium]